MIRQTWNGWNPSQSDINGDPTQLVRMDSLTLSEDGSISLIPGSTKISSGAFSTNIRKIFSRYMNSKKYRYVYLDGDIYRNYGGAASETVFDKGLVTGAGTGYGCFGVAWGHVLAFSGSVKRMDDGTNDYNVGITATSAPSVTAQTPPSVNCQALNAGTYSDWEAVEGSSVTASGGYFQADADSTSFRVTSQVGRTSSLTLDTTNFGGTGNHTLNDIFTFSVRPDDSSKLVKVRIEFLLEAPTSPSTTVDVKNYLWYEWEARENSEVTLSNDISFDTSFRQGVNVWSRLGCKRSDFNRVGTDFSKDWNAVKGIRVIFTCTEVTTCVFTDLYFRGGKNGPLNGYYEYIQINCYDSGSFVMESIPSASSSPVGCTNTYTTVTVSAYAAPVNMIKFYRRGGTLEQFYLVKTLTAPLAASFDDKLSDSDAKLVNETLNVYSSIIPNDIIGIEGPYFNRVIYITNDAIYPSFENDFSRYDTRFAIENCSSQAEYNLFIAKVSEQQILIGTTNEIYSLNGDGTYDVTTGLLNFSLVPLGIKKPPISRDFLVEDNSLIYLASDGWRRLSGSNSELLIGNLELLFRGAERYGIKGVSTLTAPFDAPICLSKGRLMYTMAHGTDGRQLMVLDLRTKNWAPCYRGITGFTPFGIHVEEDGTVLVGTDSGGDKYLRKIFDETSGGWDGSAGIPVYLETVFDDFGEKLRRKDSYAFKVLASSSGNVTVDTFKDNSTASTISLGSVTFSGVSEKIFDVTSGLGKCKTIKLRISGTVTSFKFFAYQLIADLLPEQTNVLKIQPTNLGTQSRKRLVNFPVVIDTLGNNVVFKPFVDGTQVTDSGGSPASSTFNHDGKQTFIHWFDKEIVGTDLSGLLTCASGSFEYYETPLSEIVSEKLPVSTTWLAIPPTNFGTYAKKRFNRISLVINPRGATVSIKPVLDGVVQAAQTVTGSYKQTVNYIFVTDVTAFDVGFILSGNTVFEYYEVLKPEILEVYPEPVKFLRTIPDNLGSPSKKRFNNIPLVINTEGHDVSVTPVLDGADGTPLTVNTSFKQTVNYYFTSEVKAKDIGFKLSGSDFFYFYGLLKPEQMEILPAPVKYFRTIPTNFGSYARKRFNRISFSLDSEGNSVSVTPVLDGVAQTPQTVTANGKLTRSYFFSQDVVARDVALILSSSSDFYFYDLLKPEQMEVLPEPVTFLRTPPENFGTYARKRFDNIPFVIDTRNSAVTVTPVLDGVEGTPATFTTNTKKVVSFFFSNYQVATNISLIFSGATEFEPYGLLQPQRMEVLPDPTRHLFIPVSNFGSASKKRVRTIPLVIDTRGNIVTFTPTVDGVAKTASTFNTNGKTTVFHYFTESDGVLGVDFGGTLSSSTYEFEFYEMLQPVQVEILPVGKKFDQFGPLQLERSGRAKMLILNLLTEGSSLTYKVYTAGSASPLLTRSIDTVPNVQNTYDILLPKGINSSILRFELISDSVFYRFAASARVDVQGDGTKFRTVKFGN